VARPDEALDAACAKVQPVLVEVGVELGVKHDLWLPGKIPGSAWSELYNRCSSGELPPSMKVFFWTSKGSGRAVLAQCIHCPSKSGEHWS